LKQKRLSTAPLASAPIFREPTPDFKETQQNGRHEHLLSGEVDVIINVVDSSLLIWSLELTLQLLELEVPGPVPI
jgi:hypothetical protein